MRPLSYTRHEVLEKHYADIELTFRVTESENIARLVTAQDNLGAPIHRWFRMKEAYSQHLLAHVLAKTGFRGDSLRLYDPFSGSGTSAVSAGQLVASGQVKKARVHAQEVNPFLHLISDTKAGTFQTSVPDISVLAGVATKRALLRRDGISPYPDLTTFHRRDYLSVQYLDDLLALKASVSAITEEGSQAKKLLSVALAHAIEPSTYLRRDGRALRYTPMKSTRPPMETFISTVHDMSDDQIRVARDIKVEVELADNRSTKNVRGEYFDLALFSPPYPNNIDYTEIYKLEGWLLGYYDSALDFQGQRKKSMRSHSSLSWNMPERIDESLLVLLSPILDAVPDDRYSVGRKQVIIGYAQDSVLALKRVYDSLRPGGKMAFVVGNSQHGARPDEYVIASDLILASIARSIGFTVDSINIARYLTRRNTRSHFLRESLVTATKD